MNAFVVKNNFSWGEKSLWLILRKHMLNHELPAGGFQLKLHVCPEPRSTGSTFETERSRNTRRIISMFARSARVECIQTPRVILSPDSVRSCLLLVWFEWKHFAENLCDLRKRMGCQGDECSSWRSGRAATSKSLYCCLSLPEFCSARQRRKSCCRWPQLEPKTSGKLS